MLINVLDVNLQKVAFLSNDVPGLPNYYDDEFHEYRDQGAATFKFTVKKVINNKLQSYARFLNGQSYFSFQIDGNDYLMTPASEQAIHETSEEISFFCVSLDRELMSEQANPLVNTSSHNIQWYFDQMGLISNTQITIGINEVSNLTRTINYDGQETKLARLISVIGNFDAEFEFITKLNNDGSLDSVTLNIYKENDGLDIQGVGKKRDDVRLIFGENIQAVERDVSTEGFLNATTVTGADNLSWKSASFSYTNDDGVEEFYKRAGDNTAYAPLSAKIYPAQLSKDKDDIWTRIDFTTEYKNVNDMWAYAVRQFKQYAYHQVSYTVTPSSKLVNAEIGDGPPLAKGDTVVIQDNNYIDIDGNVGLLLSARVSEKIVSETHPENNKLIFSNYKKLKNEVSTDIQAIVNQLVDAATPYRAELSTTNGTQFKNGTGSTTLSAHIFKGSATTETIADSYEWSKDGTVVAPTQTITVDASGVADKAVYSFKATVGGKVVASQSVTITNVNDGNDGKTSYTHVAWANSADGTDGFTTIYPNLNLLDGTSSGLKTVSANGWGTQNSLATNTIDFIIGQSYTYSAWIQDCDVDTRAVIYLFNSTGYTPYLGNTIKAGDSGFSSVSFAVSVDITRYEASIGFMESQASYHNLSYSRLKLELGSTATPYMPSSSEVTTADWPKYRGEYSDFTATASTDPAKYAPWAVFKGSPGDNGRGIVSSEQKYQLTQTSTKPVEPWDNSVWQTTQPTTTATNKYLWSITRTTFNLAPLTQDIVEQKAVYGDKGTDGDPGKVVSDTEPTTRFKGLTWKYSGTADLTASDGTVIHLNTEYYYNGTNWMINYLSANNIEANSIKADKIDAKNLTITDGEFVSTTTNGPVTTSTEIKDNHIAISKTDGTVNTRNDIALDSEQGLAQKFTNIDTGFYRTAGINYQGPFTSDSDGNYAQLTPQGTKLSTDVPWTILSPLGGFSGGLIRFAVKNGVAHFSLAGLSCPSMTAGNWIKCAQLPTGSIAIPSENQVTAAFANATVWGFYVSKSGGLYLQSTSNSPALNGLVNASNSFPIG
ncbi:phage tail protein [Lactococcus lactis]|uniref:phage tail protein n=1 Tax=Lactococcus lactis TaxID=1358 RepID=UPI000BF83174|nr:phage tail protein [Lactococcus lactis]PFG78673.1 phage tail protein [Lactococcus lactis]